MAWISTDAVSSWRVRLYIAFESEDAGAGPFSVWREAGGVRTLVRGAEGLPAESMIVWDTEPPLNVSLEYIVTFTAADGTPVTVRHTVSTPDPRITVAADRPVISDVVSGQTATVTVLSMGDSEISNQGKQLEVAGRRSPVWVSGTELLPARTIDLLTMTKLEDERLTKLLATGRPLLLRLSCPDLPWQNVWFVVRSRSWAKFSRNRTSPVLRHRLNVTEVDQPWPDELAVGQTLGDLHRFMARSGGQTLGAVDDYFWSLGDINSYDLRG